MPKVPTKALESVSADVELLTFRLATKQFGIDTTNIQEIVRMPRITRVPLSPDYVLGVANLRGSVTTVLNGTIRLGHSPEPITDHSRVLVLSMGDETLGFAVDEVRRLVRIPSDQIMPISTEEGKTAGSLASGVVRQAGEPIFRISPEKLIERQIRSGSGKAVVAIENSGESLEAEEQTRKVVVAQFGNEEFGIGIDLVSEVVRFIEPSPVPNAPSFLAGLITLRSHVVPVIDLRSLMERPSLRHETSLRTEQLRGEFEKALKSLDRPTVACSFLQNAHRLLQMVGVHSVSAETLLRKSSGIFEELRSTLDKAGSDSELRLRELTQQLDEIDHAAANDSDRRVLLIETEAARFGLTVDRVTQVLDIPESSIQPTPAIIPQNGIQVEALARLENPSRLILLLNLGEMIAKNSAIRAHTHRREEGESIDHMPTANQTSLGKWVSFVVGDEQFGLPIGDVVEIGRVESIARVPSAPKFIKGVINLRGTVIPVIDLRTRFEMPAAASSTQSRMIYIRSGAVQIGLLVDRVLEIIGLPEVEPPPPAVCSERVMEYLLGIAKHREQVILLLSAEKFLTQAERQRLAKTSKKAERQITVRDKS